MYVKFIVWHPCLACATFVSVPNDSEVYQTWYRNNRHSHITQRKSSSSQLVVLILASFDRRIIDILGNCKIHNFKESCLFCIYAHEIKLVYTYKS